MDGVNLFPESGCLISEKRNAHEEEEIMGVVMFVWLMGFLVSGLLVLSLVTPSGQSPIRVGNNRPPSLAACKRRGGPSAGLKAPD